MNNKLKKYLLILFMVLIVISYPLISVSSKGINKTVNLTISDILKSNNPTDGDKYVYLPILFKNYPRNNTFGIDSGGGFDKVAGTGVSWLLLNTQLNWSAVEGTKGVYKWENVALIENNLIQASQAGLQTILIISQSPTWARKYLDKGCGPIKNTEISSFARFMSEVVKRYSVPPYNVIYYQIWNEPDAPVGLPGDSVFGCWGERSYTGDKYNGGEYYGSMLKQVYASIKSANPSAQVLLGGLLLDCDPRNTGPGYCSGAPSYTDFDWNFFEGILKYLKKNNTNGFDYVPFHGYISYVDSKNPVWVEKNTGSWSASGGQVNGKIGYLKSLMNFYGINKPLMLTESAILYGGQSYTGPYPEVYQQAKSDYIVWSNANAWSQDLKATIWYTFFGWRGSQLISNGTSLPAYNALKSMVEILKYADFYARDDSVNGYTKFVFITGNKEIWLVIPTGELAGMEFTINKPVKLQKVLDIYGVEQIIDSDAISINRPTYLILTR